MHRPKFPELFENTKIVISKITGDQGLRATLDNSGIYVESTLNCCVLANALEITGRVSLESIKLSKNYSEKFLLGLINSRLLGWYYRHLLMRSLDVYPDNVKQIPIRTIDDGNPSDKFIHNTIVKSVEKVLASKRANPQADTFKLEEDIDELVYQLYGLTEEEKNIVKGKE